MSYFFPQAGIEFNVRWEDFGRENDAILNQTTKFAGIAKQISVNINSYREADTFSCLLDYRNFPFDPRTIRALGVTIFMQDKKTVFKKDGTLEIIKPQRNIYDSLGYRISGNVVFMGFADEESIEFDEDTRRIHLEGRDFTSLLIDAPHSGKIVDFSRPVDTTIQSLISELRATEKISVINRTGEDLPTLSGYGYSKGTLENQRGRKRKNESYWDVITDIVGKAGLICYIELDKLIIDKPKNVYTREALVSETPPEAYQFIYGRNLRDLSFKRKLGRQKGINIRMRSINLANKSEPVLTVDIPKEADFAWCQKIGIKQAEQTIEKFDTEGKVISDEPAPYLEFNVANIGNKERLREVGQGVWEEIGRQQIEGTLTTKEMVQKQGSVEFDLLRIRNGTPVKIEIGQGDLKGLEQVDQKTRKKYQDFSEDRKMHREALESARESFLISRGYAPDVAKTFARAIGKVHTLFYTRSVEFRIDQDNGFVMELEFINFIDTSNRGL